MNTEIESEPEVDLASLPLFSDTAPVTVPVADPLPADHGVPTSRRRMREPSTSEDDIFWQTVAALRQEASNRLAESLRNQPHLAQDTRRMLGQGIIQQVVTDHADGYIRHGTGEISPEDHRRIREAIYDGMFRLGRLQPLVDDPSVENIKIHGHDRVYVIRTDGAIDRLGPIAVSDQGFIEDLQALAARAEKSFTRASPMLDLALPDRARLAAVGWVTGDGRPHVTIRCNRFRDATLTKLRASGELDLVLQEFLAASVRAGRSLIVSGRRQGSGKTTLLRALAHEIPRDEAICTIETETELYLHEDHERHPLVTPLISRPGSGERDASGRPAGEISTQDLIPASLRHNISRIIVGEVRHHTEVDAMFQAMQMGNGSMSTVHADSPELLLARLVTLAGASTGNFEYARREVSQLFDLVVYLGMDRDPSTGRLERYITSVAEIQEGEAGRIVAHPVFAPGPDKRAIPRYEPTFMAALAEHGFDPALFRSNPHGLWRESGR